MFQVRIEDSEIQDEFKSQMSGLFIFFNEVVLQL